MPSGDRRRLRPRSLPVAKLFEDLIPVRDLPEILPLGRDGAKLAMSTVWRWRRKGRGGRRLRVTTIAGVAYVRAADLVEFLTPEDRPIAHSSVKSSEKSYRQNGRHQKAVEDSLAEEFGV